MYLLRDYIQEYSKYLGLDYEEIVEEFNEYMFEYTSKIPVDAIERISKQKENEEMAKGPLSPYTIDKRRPKRKLIIVILIGVLLITTIAVGITIINNRRYNDRSISMVM